MSKKLTKKEWKAKAQDLFKRGKGSMTYEEMSKNLKKMGISITPDSIKNRVSYGSFSFIFFLQCMKASKTSVKIELEE